MGGRSLLLLSFVVAELFCLERLDDLDDERWQERQNPDDQQQVRVEQEYAERRAEEPQGRMKRGSAPRTNAPIVNQLLNRPRRKICSLLAAVEPVRYRRARQSVANAMQVLQRRPG